MCPLFVVVAAFFLGAVTAEGGKKVFCYYGSSANGRPGIGKFWPEDIDPFLCTHVIFAFVTVTEDGTNLKANNWNDVGENGLYGRTIALKEKNPKLRVLLAVGGWKIGSKPFMPTIESENSRKAFAENAVHFLRYYGFDGMDMDWEFPGIRGSGDDDKYKFTDLMRKIYNEFEKDASDTGKEKLILTMATASSLFYINKAYEPTEIYKYVDYLLLMSYNYHGSGWEKEAGHPSPLWAHSKDPPGEQQELNQNWSIEYWLDQGVPKKKLIVGIPTYGLTAKLEDPDNFDIRAPVDGGAEKGDYSREPGILSYYEICEKVKNDGWKVEWIYDQGVPYAHGGDAWVGFESPSSLVLKIDNILKKDLGGAFVWSVEMDDFGAHCGEGKYPLLKTIYKNLKPTYDGDEEYSHSRTASKDKPREHSSTGGSRGSWSASGSSHEVKASTEKSEWVTHENLDMVGEAPDDLKNHLGEINEMKNPHSDAASSDGNDSRDYGEFNCPGLGIYADPHSCKHFYFCMPAAFAGTRSHKMDCPVQTLFDETLKICNHHWAITCHNTS